MSNQRKFDGNLTVHQLQNTVGTTENAEFVRLTSMSKSADEKMNVGEFVDIDAMAAAPPDLMLVQAAADEQVSPPEGKTMIFDATLYVEGKDARVVAFR